VMIRPAPYFLASRNTTGVGAISKLYTSIPHSRRAAIATLLTISLDGLVSCPTTHFFDGIAWAKFLQNSKTSGSVRSSPKIPRIPEMDFFNGQKPEMLFINSDNTALHASIAQPGRAKVS
jgi:hypothetical protein